MTTQALNIQNLQAAVTELQLAQTAMLAANVQSGNLATASLVTAVQTAVTALQANINTLVPVFMGNN